MRRCSLIGVLLLGLAAMIPAQKQNDPRAERIVQAYEDKLNLRGTDLTTTFTLVQKDRPTGCCRSRSTAATRRTPSL